MTLTMTDKTCETDGYDELPSGMEVYWHCEEPAVWTGEVERPGNLPPVFTTMSLCEKHFDIYHDSMEE
jgi:hypothetical protein